MLWAKATWGHRDMPGPAPGTYKCWHHLPPANIIVFKPQGLGAIFMVKKRLLWENSWSWESQKKRPGVSYT